MTFFFFNKKMTVLIKRSSTNMTKYDSLKKEKKS